jgi:hypothetical protein
MVVRQAVTYAVRRSTGMVLHPRRTLGELVADSTRVAFAGVDAAGRVVGVLAEKSPFPTAPVQDAVEEVVIERPGPVPPEVLKDAATPAPVPEPPTAERTARQVGEDIKTPSGITAAGAGSNPDTTETDLLQPGTEPLMDPATTKAVRAEAKTLSKAASRKK